MFCYKATRFLQAEQILLFRQYLLARLLRLDPLQDLFDTKRSGWCSPPELVVAKTEVVGVEVV